MVGSLNHVTLDLLCMLLIGQLKDASRNMFQAYAETKCLLDCLRMTNRNVSSFTATSESSFATFTT
jgi:hypothetical protein